VKPAVHRLEDTVEALLSRFAAAIVTDRAVGRRRRLFGWAALVSLPITVAPALLGGLAGAAVALALGIASFVLWLAYRRREIEDRKLATVLRVLRVLRADIPLGERIRLTVDLRSHRAMPPVEKKGAVSKYRQAWLSMRVRLADGNTVGLAIVDGIKRKQKRKRTKETAQSRVVISLRLAKRYRQMGPLGRRLESRDAPPGLSVSAVKVAGRDGRAVVVALRTPATISAAGPLADGDTLLGALRWLYAAISVSRRAA
jgi:hypothetical protein